MSSSPQHAGDNAHHAAADQTSPSGSGAMHSAGTSAHHAANEHNEQNKNNQQQQQMQQQQNNGYAQQTQQQQGGGVALSHGYPLSSSKHLLEQQQQRQQQQANSVQQQQHYQSSNKTLVEHAKSGQQSMDGGQTQTAQQQHASLSLPLHTSGVNAHYSQQIQQNNNNSYSSNNASPSLTISPHTGSPAGNSPYDGASVAPYTPEGMQQSGQQSYQTQGHSQQHQQSQQQGGYSHSHHQQNFAPGPSPHSSPVNQAFAQVLVAGLPLSLTQAELGDIFSSLPSYERCGIACDPTTGLSIGRGWLVFASSDYANQAIQKMNGMSLGGNILTLSMMQPIGESTKSNIYVAGLPKQYTQVQLEELFRTFGTIIESKILMDPTGMSRGVAFVRYDNSNSAAQAITAVNGHVMADASHTYTIRVKFARDHHRNADPTLAMLTGTPSPNTPPQAQSHAPRPAAIYQSYIPPHVKARGDEISGGVALFVFHIPAEFTSRDLQELFAPCATVLSARIAIHPQTLESKGFGFVTCASMEEAHQAVTLLNGRRVGRKFIKVSFKKQQTNAPGPQQHMQGQPPQHQQQMQQTHYAPASHQQPPHLQQQQPPPQHPSQSSQSPHQRNPSLDINLSSLAAALTLSQNFNSQGVSYPPQNNGWSQPPVATPSSPSLLNYGNQSALPLHLLMQQMQLSQAFPQTNGPSVQQQVHQQVAAQHQAQQQQHQQHTQHHSHHSFGGGNYSPVPAGVQNSWLPSSPINLPQSALNSNSVYNTNTNYYQQNQQQQVSHQAPQTQQTQQGQSQQHLFM